MAEERGLQLLPGDGGRFRRQIVRIDEEKCDGCGECVPACAEGAIEIAEGKARLVSDRLCDGLGACLGHCPRGAIRIEERESEAFDETAVAHRRLQRQAPPACHSVCPSTGLLDLTPSADAAFPPRATGDLGHWPVQLHLIPPTAPFLAEADLLLCAPCVPVAMTDFHARLLRGRVVALACPKLDDQTGYLEKLATIFARARPRSVSVARMTVPCCGGLLRLVRRARELAGSTLPIIDRVIGRDGRVVETSTEGSAEQTPRVDTYGATQWS